MLYDVFIYAIRCRTCTCRTCSEPTIRKRSISHELVRCVVPELSSVFWTPENGDRYVLSGVCLCVSSMRDFDSATLLFSETLISGV
jgi:hypothetical protein